LIYGAFFIKPISSVCRYARRPHITSVLMQNHRNDLSARVAFEVQLRVDNLVEELVLGVGEDRDGGLPHELCFEMTALECDIEYAKTEPEFADVLAERGGVEEKNGGERSFGARGGIELPSMALNQRYF